MDSSYTTDSNIQLNNNTSSTATGYDSDLPTDFESNYGSDYDEELAMINSKPKLSSSISNININLDNINPSITTNTTTTNTTTNITSRTTNPTKTKTVKRKRKTTTATNTSNSNTINSTDVNDTNNTDDVASVNNNDMNDTKDTALDTDTASASASASSNSTINFELKAGLFTKEELELDPNKMVFIKYCKIKNDDLIKYYIKKHMPNRYKCSHKTCPTAKTNMWKRKLTYLILNRKNNINQDCRINNIELICPNCYCQEYGSQPFEKLKHAIGKRCLKCNYPIKTEFAATQNYCYVCNKTIKNISMNYNVSTSVNNKHVQYLNKIDNEFDEFMKTNAPCNPDYDLLNDRNSILIPSNTSDTDIFTELGFDKTTYMKALETRKHMQKLQQSYTNINNTNNNTTTTNKTTSSILPASIKYKKVNQMKSSRTLASNSTTTNNNLLNDELNNIELNTNLDNTNLDDELNNI